jgi:hypothetical protein
LVIGHVPEEFTLIFVPLHRIQMPALQVIFTTEGHRVIHVSRGRYFQTHHLHAPSTCREERDILYASIQRHISVIYVVSKLVIYDKKWLKTKSKILRINMWTYELTFLI